MHDTEAHARSAGDGWLARGAEIRDYFDRTAADAWVQLTSDAPVSRIRAKVRAGRARMRGLIASWLPAELAGRRVLDAGCGTGLLTVDLARRGGHVTAIDLSPTLVEIARVRLPDDVDPAFIDLRAGDMLDPALGRFDHVVAMDSLIHYGAAQAVAALAAWAPRAERSIVFTFVPRTPLLALSHAVGRLLPRGDRAPAIQPVSEQAMRRAIAAEPGLRGWTWARTERISAPFYASQAVELVRA
jgi:magnesium-protoporphyrin O-methyltransferase